MATSNLISVWKTGIQLYLLQVYLYTYQPNSVFFKLVQSLTVNVNLFHPLPALFYSCMVLVDNDKLLFQGSPLLRATLDMNDVNKMTSRWCGIAYLMFWNNQYVPDPITRGFLLPSLSDRKPPITELTNNLWLEFFLVLQGCQSFHGLHVGNPIKSNICHS